MKLFSLTASALLFASTAMAADAIVYETAPEAVADTFIWTGGYVGVNAGYAGGKFKHPFSGDGFGYDGSMDGSLDVTSSGFVGGVQAGYNWQINQTVIGLETDFQGSGVKGEVSGNLAYDGFDFIDARASTKVNWFGTTRARVGYVPTERFMVYATGGAAYGKVKSSASFSVDGGDFGGEISKSKTKFGYVAGAGAEYAVTNNVTLKTEYLYTDLGKMNLVNFNDDYSSFSADAKVKFHTVRVGLNYKF